MRLGGRSGLPLTLMIRILGERFEVRIDAQTTDPDFEAIPQSDKYPLLNSHLRPNAKPSP